MSSPLRQRRGTTIIELLVVILLVSILLGILIPVLGAVRESSRLLSCSNNLRQLGLAAFCFESARRRVVPGTLGHRKVVNFEDSHDEKDSPDYWGNFQYTSLFGSSLEFMDEPGLRRLAHDVLFDMNHSLADYRNEQGHPEYVWFGSTPNYDRISEQQVAILQCPSDTGDDDVVIFAAVQPVYNSEFVDALSWIDLAEMSDAQHATSDYAGCAGAHSGGITSDRNRLPYTGMASSGGTVRHRHVTDGLSNTIFVGETLGGIVDGEQITRMSWFSSGIARGRGTAAWMDPDPLAFLLLGNSDYASPVGFSSAHPQGVKFLAGDGHVFLLSRGVEWKIIYSLCGRSDGDVLSTIVLSSEQGNVATSNRR